MINIALRSLGNQLVAKNAPGAKFRQSEEANVTTPEIPGKGDVGTLSRAQVEEPLTRAVPSGSEKIAASQPSVEATAIPTSDITPPVDLLSQQSIPESSLPNVSQRQTQGGAGQALFQGGVSTPGQASAATGVPSFKAPLGKTGSTTSQPGNPVGYTTQGRIAAEQAAQAAAQQSQGQVLGAQTQQQGQQSPQYQRESFLPAVAGKIAGKVIAAPAQQLRSAAQNYVPTLQQYLLGGAGKVASTAGNIVNNPGLRSFGNQLQSVGGQPNIGIPGIVQTAQNIGNNLRSAASNTLNSLRSGIGKLFGR